MMNQEALWIPSHPELTKMQAFIDYVNHHHQLNIHDYHQLHQWSINFPSIFWQDIIDFFSIIIDKPGSMPLHQSEIFYQNRWFEDATLNYAKNLLKRRDDATAIISVNENNEQLSLSFAMLYHEVSKAVAGLKALGIGCGDRVSAMMPNCAYTVIAMLACSAIGAIWSSCSPDFGADAAIDRFSQVEPKLLIVCNAYHYAGKRHSCSSKINQVINAIPTIQHTILVPFCEILSDERIVNSLLWSEFLKDANDIDFLSLPFNHPLFIMFSSGTTGKPKCIVHGAGGTLLQHVKELGLHTDLHPDDRFCFYTTCGWMMWNWMVSALSLGVTLVLYDGSPAYPGSDRLIDLADKLELDVLGTSPKYISSLIHASDKKNPHMLNRLKTILSTGAPLLPVHFDYVYQHIKSDVHLASISGGTDIISCFALGNPMLPVYRGEIQCLGLGMDVAVFDDSGKAVEQKRGELVCKKPFPSMPIYFWNDDNHVRFQNAYFDRFPGIWAHGDFAETTLHGGLIIHGRSDAVLNPGGVRIGTAEIYRQVEKCPYVVDSVVIGQQFLDDVRVILFVQMKDGIPLTEAIINEIKQLIKSNTTPRHVPAKILEVSGIPRTINGKVLELLVKQLVDGVEINNLNSVANPQVLDDFKNRPELRIPSESNNG